MSAFEQMFEDCRDVRGKLNLVFCAMRASTDRRLADLARAKGLGMFELLSAPEFENDQRELAYRLLLDSVQRADSETLAQVIRAGVVSVDQRHDDMPTALMWAAKYGHLDALRQLLRAGADLRAKSFSGTALHFAAQQPNPACMIELLAEANKMEESERIKWLNATNSEYRTALHVAVISGSEQTVSLLLGTPHVNDKLLDNRYKKPLDYARTKF